LQEPGTQRRSTTSNEAKVEGFPDDAQRPAAARRLCDAAVRPEVVESRCADLAIWYEADRSAKAGV